MRFAWFRRGKAPAEAPGPPQFDALIDVDPGLLDQAVPHQTACAIVARAAAALPGAAWINVEVHRQDVAVSVRVFPAGSGLAQAGQAWTDLAKEVERAAWAALDPLRPRGAAAGPSLILPELPVSGAGMAEAMSPTQLDALAALTALAHGHAPPAARAAAPDGTRPGTGPSAQQQQQALASLALLAQTARPARPAKPAPRAAADPAAGDAAIMARLLGFVLPADPRATATAAVRHFGSFAAVLAAPETELRQVPGLGTHCVAAVKLVHAAAVRLQRARASRQPVLDQPEQLSAYLAAALARERIEQFRILFLDERGMLRADEVQARGTVNHTPVYPREVVRRALELGAASIVLVHNHPSGDPEPSPDDLSMTRQVDAAAAVMGIGVRDHVIVGNGRWLSFREQGFLG